MIYLSKKLIFSARRAFFLRFIAPPREEYTSRALLISRWKFEVHSARYLSSRGLRRPEGCDKWLWPREPRLRWPTVLPQNDDSYTLLVLLFYRRDLARKPWSVCTRYNYTSRYFILCEKRRIKGKMKVNRRIASSSFMYIEQEFTPGGTARLHTTPKRFDIVHVDTIHNEFPRSVANYKHDSAIRNKELLALASRGSSRYFLLAKRRAYNQVLERVHTYMQNDLRALDSVPIPPYNSETGDKSDSPGSFLPPLHFPFSSLCLSLSFNSTLFVEPSLLCLSVLSL